jgi:hypothetical protein
VRHRQAVRLTNVTADYDPVYQHAIVHIEWGIADALTFSLCLSTIGPAPECKLLQNVSVARGNVLLVDHGRWERREPLGVVTVRHRVASCEGEGDAADTLVEIERLRPPALSRAELTFSQAMPGASTPASQCLTQDPRQALPAVKLVNVQRLAAGAELLTATAWHPHLDLIDSGGEDLHFVVEVDNEGLGHLRFGDGRHGKLPQPTDPVLFARYRTGTGPVGNVAAESITYAVTDQPQPITRVRNPMAAQGGIAPEDIEAVKRFAPGTFSNELARAISPDDYSRLAEQYSPRQAGFNEIQRAFSTLRWTGSWYEMLVTVDPLAGTRRYPHPLLAEIEAYLERFRRIGHDLDVQQARYVPLYIELCVTVLPPYFQGHIKAALQATFGSGKLPNGQRGVFHPDNLSFGQPIHLSTLLAAAAGVTGVESVRVTQFRRLDAPASASAQAINDGVLQMGPMEIAQVESNPSAPDRGQIVFTLEGGQ